MWCWVESGQAGGKGDPDGAVMILKDSLDFGGPFGVIDAERIQFLNGSILRMKNVDTKFRAKPDISVTGLGNCRHDCPRWNQWKLGKVAGLGVKEFDSPAISSNPNSVISTFKNCPDIIECQ